MKHVIVTGASRGLGQVLVEGLLAEAYHVSACGRSKSEFVDKMSTHPVNRDHFFWKSCSVQDSDQVAAFVDEAVQRAGTLGLYGVVNNAGIAGEGVLAIFPPGEAAKIIEVNLLGAVYVSRAVLRYLIRSQTGGRIINISSIIGLRGYTGLAAYSASKAGMDGLTRSLAREVGRRQITCNSVAPGYLSTDMSSSLTPEQRTRIINRTPLKRLGTPYDVLEAVKFLLSEKAAFITGQTLVVDGGISC